MPRILVCDDTPDILEMVQLILETEGYQVVTAGTGPALLAAVETEAPDLVLLDLRMPGLDGFSVMKELRRSPERRLPVVILSAKGREEDRRAAMAGGASAYLTKPFTVAQLVSTVKGQLEEVR